MYPLTHSAIEGSEGKRLAEKDDPTSSLQKKKLTPKPSSGNKGRNRNTFTWLKRHERGLVGGKGNAVLGKGKEGRTVKGKVQEDIPRTEKENGGTPSQSKMTRRGRKVGESPERNIKTRKRERRQALQKRKRKKGCAERVFPFGWSEKRLFWVRS